LQEYAFEGFNLFEEMKANIRLNVAKLLFRVVVRTEQPLQRRERQPARVSYDDGGSAPVGIAAAAARVAGGQGAPAQTKTAPIEVGEKVGRNDPCPCGSGKKYKYCHGRVAA
jgi:preprotein translocase subunit SecA